MRFDVFVSGMFPLLPEKPACPVGRGLGVVGSQRFVDETAQIR